jgi:hypothetical protein
MDRNAKLVLLLLYVVVYPGRRRETMSKAGSLGATGRAEPAHGAKRRSAGVAPDVRSPTTTLAELNVVHMRRRAILEQGQELVLGAVEAAHAGVGLRPDNEVQRLET